MFIDVIVGILNYELIVWMETCLFCNKYFLYHFSVLLDEGLLNKLISKTNLFTII